MSRQGDVNHAIRPAAAAERVERRPARTLSPAAAHPARASREALQNARAALAQAIDGISFLSNGLELPPRRSIALAKVLQGAGSRALATSRAVVRLTHNPLFGPEALSLARGMWELAMAMDYVCGTTSVERELRAIRYLAHGYATFDRVASANRVSVRRVRKLPQNRAMLHALLVGNLARRKVPASRRDSEASRLLASWASDNYATGKSPSQLLALLTRNKRKRARERKRFYTLMSGYSHAGGGSILAFSGEPEETIAVDETTARLACRWSAEWLVEVFALTAAVYGLNWGFEIRSLRAAIKAI